MLSNFNTAFLMGPLLLVVLCITIEPYFVDMVVFGVFSYLVFYIGNKWTGKAISSTVLGIELSNFNHRFLAL